MVALPSLQPFVQFSRPILGSDSLASQHGIHSYYPKLLNHWDSATYVGPASRDYRLRVVQTTLEDHRSLHPSGH